MLRILFRDVPIEESDEDKPGFILDYDKQGNLVGIEVLNARNASRIRAGDSETEEHAWLTRSVRTTWPLQASSRQRARGVRVQRVGDSVR